MVQRVFPGATVVRPGAMFGPGDALFSTLAELAQLLPALPLIGSGSTRLQPVFVEDVAEAIARILTDPGTVGRCKNSIETEAESKFKAAQTKAEKLGVDKLTIEDIEGLSREQIKQLRGY